MCVPVGIQIIEMHRFVCYETLCIYVGITFVANKMINTMMASTTTPIIIIILVFLHHIFLATRVDVFWNESA